MHELVHVQLGQAGSHIGSKFYEIIAEEHGILPDGSAPGATEVQLECASVYFSDGPAGRFVPRAVLVDTDPGSLDNVRSSPYGSLFSPDDYVYGQGGTGNNWAKGYYTEGSELLDPVLDVIRRKAENCDLLHGFQICHSLGGGTGSGFGTLVLNKLREEYPAEIVATFSVVPSPKVSDTVVEPYNTMLSLSQLIENADEVFVLDNEALYDICVKRLKLATPTYGDLNHLICTAMSNTTSCFRFPGQPFADLRKLGVNLIPFPRIHFFSIGMAPLLSRGAQVFETVSTSELIRNSFNPRNAMCAVSNSGSQIASCAILRGKHLSVLHIQEQLCQLVNSNSANFIEWIPDNCISCVCEVPSKGLLTSCTTIINSTSIQNVFARVRGQYAAMMKRKAFLHWYTGEGMDEMEFVQAEENVSDLISEYQQYESIADDAGKYVSDYEGSDDDEPEQEDNLK